MIENYEKYLVFLNNKLKGFFDKQKPYIKCKKGCAKCCKNAEFPYSFMEFKYLLTGFMGLDKQTQDIVEENIKNTAEQKKSFTGKTFFYDCPFLINDACCVYDYRGIVCRTFGLMAINKDKNGNTKAPFCIHEGLNYSMVLDEKTNKISMEKFKESGFKVQPLGFNISYGFLTDEAFEKKYKFNFGEKRPLIDWFIQK